MQRRNSTHHLQHFSGDHLHTAHGGGESTHNGGDDVQGAHTEEQLLQEADKGEEGGFKWRKKEHKAAGGEEEMTECRNEPTEGHMPPHVGGSEER